MKSIIHLFILALAGMAFFCNAQQDSQTVRAELRPEASVEGRAVTLGDVARLEGLRSDRQTAMALTRLAASPQPGYALHLSQREVVRLLHEAGLHGVVVTGAPAITITTVAIPYNPELLVDAASAVLTKALQQEGRKIELTPAEAAPEIKLPRGEVSLRARVAANAQPRRQMTAWVDISLDGALYRTVPLVFTVSLMEPVLVTRVDMSKGQAAACTNLEIQQRDIAALPSTPQTGDCANMQHRLRRNVAAGSVLMAGELEPIPAVSEGDLVTLEVTNGAVSLESRALALTDGQIGQRIAVRATTSQESILATVVAPGVVNLSGR